MADLFKVSSGLSAASLTSLPASTRSSTASGGIEHAAREFESILLNQWLEGAESSFGSVPGAEDDQDAGDAQMKSFAVQALSKGITAAGGIGLSHLVSKALEAHTASPAPTSGGSRPR